MNSWLDFFVAGLATQLQEVRSKGEVAIRADVLAADKGLNERQAELVGAFFGRGGLTLGDAERLFPAVTRRTIQRDLKRLVDLGLVTDLGQGATDPNRAYRWTAPRHESR